MMTIQTTDKPTPIGQLALQTLSMPKDTNANGDIFGGWLVSQMDLAAGIATKVIARGRCATVAIQNVNFIQPVSVGSVVSCYTRLVKTGRSSIHIQVDVWVSRFSDGETERETLTKVADGLFIFVAIDGNGNSRELPKESEETMG